jgi:hypothetical protein
MTDQGLFAAPPKLVTQQAVTRLPYTPRDYYWQLSGHTKVYSSARNIEVLTTDQDYQDWLAKGYLAPVPIDTEANLWPVVHDSCPDMFPDWLFNGTSFIQPAINNYNPPQIKAYAAMVRYDKEVGGINYTPASGPSQGIKLMIDTARASVVNINNATLSAQADSSYTTQWKTKDGIFHSIDATTMIQMNVNVQAHVRTCFETEQTCQSYTTITAVDDAFALIGIDYT